MSATPDLRAFFDPQARTGRGVAFDTAIRGIRRALLQAAADAGFDAAEIRTLVPKCVEVAWLDTGRRDHCLDRLDGCQP